MIKKSILLNIYFFLLIAYIFTNYIYGHQGQIIVGLSIFAILIILLSNRRKIKLLIGEYLLIFLCLYFACNALISSQYSVAITYSFSFFFLSMAYIFLKREQQIDYDYIEKLLFLFSSIHMIATLVYQLYPSLIQAIIPNILSSNDLQRNLYEFNINGINCGITPIQGLNAFYISIFIMLSFNKLLIQKKRILYLIYLIFGFIALFLTSKRGFLVANIFSIIFTFFLFNSKQSNKLRKNIKYIFLLAIFYILFKYVALKYFPSSFNLLSRFNQNDLSTGRTQYWEFLLSNVRMKNIIFGTGLFSTRNLYLSMFGSLNDAHNIYLQLFVETGIVGVSFIFIIAVNLFKKIFNSKEMDSRTLNYSYFIVLLFIYGLFGNWFFDLNFLSMFFLIVLIFNQKEGGKTNEKNGNNNIS